MIDGAGRWGILPAYTGWQGELVETPRSTSDAILAALGATQDRPPRVRRLKVPDEPCAPAPDRAWGWAIQLYALRSRESWGIGDLADLRRFGRWSRRRGGSVILLNPLGAQTPTVPYEPSPYYASSRRFRNTLYLRIDEIEGAERCAAELQPLREAAPKPPGLDVWVRRQGRALHDFATFNALAEVHGTAWRSWPAYLRHPRNDGIEPSRRRLADRIAFHEWQQFHIDR